MTRQSRRRDQFLAFYDASGEEAQRYVAILRASGPSEFMRPDGWNLAGADDTIALFSRVVDGPLQLAVLRDR
ncbi:MAG: hypothetical protein WCC60_21350 [Ilumatobacteraceae bacterium]